MKLGYNLALLMFAFGALFLGITQLFFYFHEHRLAVTSATREALRFTNEIAHQLESRLIQETKTVELLATAINIQDAMEQSNQEYDALPRAQRDERIAALDIRWRTTKEVDDPFIQAYTNNEIARHLAKISKTTPGVYGEIFVTNRYGVLLASTNRLTTLAHAHKYWWEGAFYNGKGRIYLDDRGFDKSASEYVLGVVLPIKKGEDIIGILKANINIQGGLSSILWSEHAARVRQIQLARTGGLVVLERDHPPLSTQVSSQLKPLLAAGTEGSVMLDTEQGKRLFTYTPVLLSYGSEKYGFGGKGESLDQSRGNQGEGWMILLSMDKATIFEYLNENLFRVFMGATISTLLMAAFALILGHRMSQPIKALAMHAKRIGEGDFSSRVRMHTGGELGELLDEFNKMATRLKKTTTSRDTLAEEVKRRKEAEEKLRLMSLTDELTGLYNRRGFFALANERAKQVKRHNEELYLLYADVDDLKQVNDTYGHESGDEVIKEAAEVLTQTFRESDIICRMGGDEFAVLMGEKKGGHNADSANRRLWGNIDAINQREGRDYRLSMSMGVVKCDLEQPFSLSRLISRADKAMYECKKRKQKERAEG